MMFINWLVKILIIGSILLVNYTIVYSSEPDMLDGKNPVSISDVNYSGMRVLKDLKREAVYGGIKIKLDKVAIYHFDNLNISLEVDSSGVKKDGIFTVKVINKGKLVYSAGVEGEVKLLPLGIDDNGKSIYTGVFLPPYNAPEGVYRVLLYLNGEKISNMNSPAFYLFRKSLQPICDGFSAIDLEMNKDIKEYSIRGIDGKVKGPEALLEWAALANGDAIWILSGETTSFHRRKPLDNYPFWDYGPVSNLNELKKKAHEYGLKVGAYIISFFVPGPGGVPERYKPGIGYNKKNNTLYRSRHISIGCENRIRDIIELVKNFQGDPYIDYIGFDFIRTGRGDGYELVNDFVKDTGIAVPINWKNYSSNERIVWLAKEIEAKKNHHIIEKWRWWRASRVAKIVKRIIAEAHITKPVWVFTLGWEHGWEHGQDPVMFFDAGVTVDAVMLYEAREDQFNRMMEHWKRYLGVCRSNVIVGNCIDYKLLDSKELSAPDELFRRYTVSAESMADEGFVGGFFLHDLFRALWGRRGGYSTEEYILSFSRALFRLRLKLREKDILTDILIPNIHMPLDEV